ncbi:MAG: UDP-glucose 4-epimerase [Actinomycetota bacterium]|nr:UDP-glucose 4-epimerase [Actinomycetota bacterium]
MIFSSSASVYASHPGFSVDEESRLVAASPYARTKLMFEWILQDLAATGRMNVVSLRYFNPVGCDPLMRTGLQDPTPTHALGKLIEAFQKREPFMVTGVDWPTPDGTAIRDYIHVWDLARAHVAAADWLLETREPCVVINLGTGRGTSVRELVDAFGSVVGRPIEIVEVERRPGDVVGCYTTSDKARRLLGWEAEKTLAEGIRDSLAWTRYRDEVLGDPQLTIDLDEGWVDVETDMNVALR